VSRVVGRMVMHDVETHFEVPPGTVIEVGDTFEVVRGNGPREGSRMGTATVVALGDGGAPVLDVSLPDGVHRIDYGEGA
jgi:hypothetical protein